MRKSNANVDAKCVHCKIFKFMFLQVYRESFFSYPVVFSWATDRPGNIHREWSRPHSFHPFLKNVYTWNYSMICLLHTKNIQISFEGIQYVIFSVIFSSDLLEYFLAFFLSTYIISTFFLPQPHLRPCSNTPSAWLTFIPLFFKFFPWVALASMTQCHC